MIACVMIFRLGVRPMCMVYIWLLCTSIQAAAAYYYCQGLQANSCQTAMYLRKSPCFLVMVGLLLYWNMMKMQNQHTDYYDPLVVILRCWFHLLVVKDMLFGYEKACAYRDLFHMEGMDVMRFSLKEVVTMINDFKERFVCDYDEYEILACHQANKLIISNLARKIKFPLSKIPLSIVDYGNTGCASIPLAICEHYSNKNTSQDSGKILTCGFGIGLSLGIVGITVEPQNCFPVFRVKERYDDGLSFEDYK